MIITDEMLREAGAQAEAAILAALPEPEDCTHEFSPAFRRRMETLLKRQRHPALRRIARRAAAVLLAALLGAGTWLTVDVQAREAFFQWVREFYEDQIVYRFFGEQQEDFPAYRPAWVPEGYVETDFFNGHAIRTITYENAKGDVFYLDYSPMQEGSTLSIPTEGITPQSVFINGLPGHFYESSSAAYYNELVWMDENANIMFDLTGSPEKSVMLHIAKSISLDDSTK